ncbi:lamin tail domain-containing protein [Patescibacteria group bacterium]|nr:lamin tail domain-containing protein [Patescibacteria group bacterium]
MRKLFPVLIGSVFGTLFFCVFSALADEPAVYINEVGFKEDNDFIELFVAADANLAHYEIWEGGTIVATLPDSFTYQEGDLILIHEESGVNDVKKSDNSKEAYDLFAMGSLTGTDNIIQIKKPDDTGTVVDVVIWSNANGSFTGSKLEANNALTEGLWDGDEPFSSTSDSSAWTDSDEVTKGFSLQRTSIGFPVSPDDFEVNVASPGVVEPENSPPIASAVCSASVVEGNDAQFDGTGSSDPDGDMLSYAWDFGDDGTAETSYAAHTYQNIGTYTATLVVTDAYGLSSNDSCVVSVSQKKYSHTLIISELLPDPIGDDASGEFIELTNTGQSSVDLDGYQVSDGSKTYTISSDDFDSTVVASSNYFLIPRAVSSIALNNTNDHVFLRDPHGTNITDVQYDQSQEGYAYAYNQSVYTWTKTPTPGAKNVIEQDPPPEPKETKDPPKTSPPEPAKPELPSGTCVSNVSITELMPNPQGEDAQSEWIELYNGNDVAVDLARWKLDDAEGGSVPYEFMTQTPVGAHSYAVFNRAETSIALNNSNESVRLFCPDGSDVSSASFEGSAPEGSSYASQGTVWSWTTTPTPGSNNVITGESSDTGGNVGGDPTPSSESNTLPKGPFSRDVFITELVPNPKGVDADNEWIELYNAGDKDVSLGKWQIDDEEGGSKPYTIPDETVIKAKTYVVFTSNITKLQLKNTVDSARLIAPDGTVISGVRYNDKILDDVSFARDDSGKWHWTTTPTKGTKNTFTAVSSNKKTSTKSTKKSTATKTSTSKAKKDKSSATLMTIAEALTKEKGEFVKLSGTITVAPGMLAKRSFYIQDDTGGMQLYKSKDDVPNVAVGDEVEVVGKISVAQGEKRVLIAELSDVTVISKGKELKIDIFKTGEVTDQHLGKIIRVKGVLIKKEGNVLYLDDGSGVLKIVISTGSGLKAKDFVEGIEYEVTGLLRLKDGAIVLSPRMKEDVIFAEDKKGTDDLKAEALQSSSSLPFKSSVIWIIVGVAAFIAAVIKGIYILKKQKRITK